MVNKRTTEGRWRESDRRFVRLAFWLVPSWRGIRRQGGRRPLGRPAAAGAGLRRLVKDPPPSAVSAEF